MSEIQLHDFTKADWDLLQNGRPNRKLFEPIPS